MSTLLSATVHELPLERLGSRPPNTTHLGDLAQALGRLHAPAYRTQLHTARLDQPFPTQHGLIISDFVTPRRTAVETLPASGDIMAGQSI